MPTGTDQPPAPPRDGYSVANAARFGWSSVSGNLNAERVRLLDRAVVGTTVLDAGCGGGAYVDYLAGRGLDATGVDKYEMYLGMAREKGLRGTFRQADLTAGLPFPDRAFDTTVCFDVLEHVDDAAAIQELARVTRRRLLLTVPRDDDRMGTYLLAFSTYRDPTHLRYYTPDSLRALAATVRPAAVEVFGEQMAGVKALARDWLRPRGRTRVLTRLYGRAFEFLLRRAADPALTINLCAVIDLDPAGAG